MVTELPTLKIGCGKEVYTGLRVDADDFFYCKADGLLCDSCKHNKEEVLPVLLAHAHSHDKKFKQMPCDEYKEARDAVLALAPQVKLEED